MMKSAASLRGGTGTGILKARERMVGSIMSRLEATMMMSVPAGGSSKVLSTALAASLRMSPASGITAHLRPPSAGDSLRKWHISRSAPMRTKRCVPSAASSSKGSWVRSCPSLEPCASVALILR